MRRSAVATLSQNVPLAPLATLAVGGAARYSGPSGSEPPAVEIEGVRIAVLPNAPGHQIATGIEAAQGRVSIGVRPDGRIGAADLPATPQEPTGGDPVMRGGAGERGCSASAGRRPQRAPLGLLLLLCPALLLGWQRRGR